MEKALGFEHFLFPYHKIEKQNDFIIKLLLHIKLCGLMQLTRSFIKIKHFIILAQIRGCGSVLPLEYYYSPLYFSYRHQNIEKKIYLCLQSINGIKVSC